MTENLENRCMSLHDEALQINCSDNGADTKSRLKKAKTMEKLKNCG